MSWRQLAVIIASVLIPSIIGISVVYAHVTNENVHFSHEQLSEFFMGKEQIKSEFKHLNEKIEYIIGKFDKKR